MDVVRRVLRIGIERQLLRLGWKEDCDFSGEHSTGRSIVELRRDWIILMLEKELEERWRKSPKKGKKEQREASARTPNESESHRNLIPSKTFQTPLTFSSSSNLPSLLNLVAPNPPHDVPLALHLAPQPLQRASSLPRNSHLTSDSPARTPPPLPFSPPRLKRS